MTFAELAAVCDEGEGEEIRDCGVPLVMNSQDGIACIECQVCGLKFECRSGKWEVVHWGNRGERYGNKQAHAGS